MIGLFLSVAMGIMYLNVHRMGQPEELLPLIRPHLLLQLTSLVFVMMFNSFKQFADGITDTKTSMWIMLSANLLNIIGNSLLIYGVWGLPALGLTGAGDFYSGLGGEFSCSWLLLFSFSENNLIGVTLSAITERLITREI